MIHQIKNIMKKKKALAIVSFTYLLFIIFDLMTLFYDLFLGLILITIISIISDFSWLIYAWQKELKQESQIKKIIKHNKAFMMLTITYLLFIISDFITLFWDLILGLQLIAMIAIISDLNYLIYLWRQTLQKDHRLKHLIKHHKALMMVMITYFLFIISNLITLLFNLELGLKMMALIAIISNLSWIIHTWKQELHHENKLGRK